MAAGYRGTFVISVEQTETDGIVAAPPPVIDVGSTWCWRGEALRVDGPARVLALDGAAGEAELRQRAARVVARLIGPAAQGRRCLTAVTEPTAGGAGFAVTDGLALYRLTPLDPAGRLLAVIGALPPLGVDLAVVAARLDRAAPEAAAPGGVICFTPGTRIATPEGLRPVEAIRPGDRVSTRDNGPQEVLWTGARRMSGARLHAMPALRPVRIGAGAPGRGRSQGDLIVSPDHRILVAGAAARALFGEDEVLAAARDLVDGRHVRIETGLREVTYVHLLTARHEVICANGRPAETFHPAAADPAALDPADRAALHALVEGLAADPFRYGGFARRSLSAPEAAILRHRAA
jgi:hypothetical protein